MNQKGQALIILIVVTSVALTILTAGIMAATTLAKSSLKSDLGKQVYFSAEGGIEYGILQLMRNPSGCSGNQSYTQNSVTININYTVSGPDCVIESVATKNSTSKKIQATGSYNSSNIFQVCCWKEIP